MNGVRSVSCAEGNDEKEAHPCRFSRSVCIGITPAAEVESGEGEFLMNVEPSVRTELPSSGRDHQQLVLDRGRDRSCRYGALLACEERCEGL
jgi:hypothetical protein